MVEFLLTTHPWILAVVYAISRIANNACVSYGDWYYDRVYRDLPDSEGSSRSPDDDDEFDLQLDSPAVVLGVCILLVCAYWEIIPRGFFLFVSGTFVLMSSTNLLLYALPALVFWKQLHKAGFRGKGIDRDSNPFKVRAWMQYFSRAIFFGLCWILTENFIFVGPIACSLALALPFPRRSSAVEDPDETHAPNVSTEEC
jgi:hypothetical protein